MPAHEVVDRHELQRFDGLAAYPVARDLGILIERVRWEAIEVQPGLADALEPRFLDDVDAEIAVTFEEPSCVSVGRSRPCPERAPRAVAREPEER
ncbi:MAG TPA: hypothetical protein VEY33_03925, partial [Gemmatimonadota bacterium]|nr:hypothetical protein [Gemmatimonadota bacterium]